MSHIIDNLPDNVASSSRESIRNDSIRNDFDSKTSCDEFKVNLNFFSFYRLIDESKLLLRLVNYVYYVSITDDITTK